MAVQRLLPVAQQAYAGWAKLSGAVKIIDDTLLQLDASVIDGPSGRRLREKLSFKNEIRFHDVSFCLSGRE